jgi:hypothetical protein
MEEAVQLITIKRQMQPAMKIFLFVCLLIGLAAMFQPDLDKYDWKMASAGLIGIIAAFGFNVPQEMGYYIRYDYDTIYYGQHGYETLYIRRHPQITMRFDDIGSMSTGFENEGAFDRAFMPFDSFYLHHKDGSSPDIFLHGASFTDSALRDFLHFLRERRPGIMTDDVVNYLEHGL